MKSFREHISTIEESYTKSAGYKDVIQCLTKLEGYLSPSSRLAKAISSEMGQGYIKDFEKMQKLLGEISSIFEEIDSDIERQ